jgi:hypothetical protein
MIDNPNATTAPAPAAPDADSADADAEFAQAITEATLSCFISDIRLTAFLAMTPDQLFEFGQRADVSPHRLAVAQAAFRRRYVDTTMKFPSNPQPMRNSHE